MWTQVEETAVALKMALEIVPNLDGRRAVNSGQMTAVRLQRRPNARVHPRSAARHPLLAVDSCQRPKRVWNSNRPGAPPHPLRHHAPKASSVPLLYRNHVWKLHAHPCRHKLLPSNVIRSRERLAMVADGRPAKAARESVAIHT